MVQGKIMSFNCGCSIEFWNFRQCGIFCFSIACYIMSKKKEDKKYAFHMFSTNIVSIIYLLVKMNLTSICDPIT